MKGMLLLAAVAAAALTVALAASAAPPKGGGGSFTNYSLAETTGTTCPGDAGCSNVAAEPAIRADGAGRFFGTSENNLLSGTVAFRSTDNGASWTAVNNGLTNTEVRALAVSGTTPKSGTLVATDIDSASLTYSLVTPPGKGSVTTTNASTGAYTYTATSNASATDTFTFMANDGTANSNTATVTADVWIRP